MESDSDSDDSYISATRNSKPPSPRRRRRHNQLLLLRHSHRGPHSPLTNPDLGLKNPHPEQNPQLHHSIVLHEMTPRRFSLLFPIYRFRSALLLPYKQPAHFPPLVQSKPYLPVTFGDLHHSPKSNDLISLSTQSKLHLTHTEEADSIPPTNYNKQNVVKKHSNLITANAPLLPVKLRNGGEGNFVKLNMNHKRKFLNKRGRKKKSSYASAGYRSYRRSKRSVKRVKEGEGGSNCEEDGGLVVEATQKEARKSSEVVEEVVMAVRNEASDENLVRLLNAVYGYDSFGDGQLEAIKMVLDGKSTMLGFPTGAGKSLCYQIPATVLEGITLVVSPLVALMIDQLKQLPWVTQGRLLCSSQTPEEVAEILRLLQEGAIKVLFVSPERFLNAELMSTFFCYAALYHFLW